MNKQERRIAEKANYAIHEWIFACSEVGTFYSKRGQRTYRGKPIN